MAEDAEAAGRTVISKAAMILMTYLEGDTHSLTEIAAATGLPLSTAHRLLRELAAWRILDRTDDGDYCVGLPLRIIGSTGSSSVEVEERGPLILQDLSQQLDAEVRLGVLGAHDVAYIEKLPGRRPVSTFGQGATLPAHATAMGKVLLAFSPPEVVNAFISSGLEAYTPFTITAPDRLWRALAMTRLSRLGVSRRELEHDRCAFAVPVFGCGGRIAAAIELRVHEPVAELNVVRPALVIAGRSLTRELSDIGAIPSCGPRVRPRFREPAGAVRRIRTLDSTARKAADDG